VFFGSESLKIFVFFLGGGVYLFGVIFGDFEAEWLLENGRWLDLLDL
jgi:hypothetical protein